MIELDNTVAYSLIIILIVLYVWMSHYSYANVSDTINNYDKCIKTSCLQSKLLQ